MTGSIFLSVTLPICPVSTRFSFLFSSNFFTIRVTRSFGNPAFVAAPAAPPPPPPPPPIRNEEGVSVPGVEGAENMRAKG